ncbi:MAG: cysteine rich repeat-containing protein [Nitrospira sp.]|nr:cysteine rich repeat-containing protein [Nitrospira sp.]
MARQDAWSRIAAGAITAVGLTSVWLAVATSLPTQEELAGDALHQARAASAAPVVPAEPSLDLSIPGVVAPIPPAAQPAEQSPSDPSGEARSSLPIGDARTAQITRLKCDAEFAQVCPDGMEGVGAFRCLERRMKDLLPPCQVMVRERLVKWKEDRSRTLSACRDDVRRLCATMRPGDGRVMQCLQDHAQDVSDRCYQTLPKGVLLFRQP